jgi:hypothetical protein
MEEVSSTIEQLQLNISNHRRGAANGYFVYTPCAANGDQLMTSMDLPFLPVPSSPWNEMASARDWSCGEKSCTG